ncbi:hypothetical protein RHSIM_Rhsim01G0253800 [Rhododendron simsii]|uniref:Acyl-[acyl-carrier-protein] hydrolase n=1 Tax=Rhododendron simsii TaxID=118357 RepID=A0A834LWA3_RHOSS|nr:hypothetical protein RHSIM_Rhsim01G0253800 [Rhododendron simsii]
MLKLPSSSTSLSSSSSSSCNAALIRKQCRSFGASSDSPSRLKVSIRRRNYAVSCEAADSSASSSAPLVAETKEKDASGRVGKSAADRLRQGSLMEDGLSYKEKFIVRCYEEVACNHVQSLGFSTDGFGTTTTMRKLHLIWATARMHIEIYKYPAWSDVVDIETWYESEGPIWTRRDWILKDYATREVIGRATRLAFPEEKNGRLKKIAKLEDAARYSRQGLVVRSFYFSRLWLSASSPTRMLWNLQPRRADLDMNQHVNNVAYIGWFLEVGKVELLCIFILRFSKRHGLFVSADSAVRLEFPRSLSIPQEIIDSHELETITLDYRRECQQHDVVDSHTSPEPVEDTEGKEDYCQFLHLLRLSGDGLEINRGRTEWRKKPTNKTC